MKTVYRLLLSAALFLGITPSLFAQIPQMIAYQGRVAAGGVNFHGTGQFKFALVRGNYGGNPGETFALWTHDGTGSTVDPAVVPTGSVSVVCDRGLYSVLLGNTTAGMVAVPPAAFANPDVRLRVWFNDGSRGFQQLTPDQRLVSVGYAMVAGTAQTVADGSINSLKLTDGAVTAGKLADNSVTTAKLVNDSVTGAKIAFGAVDSSRILDGTITAADILDGTIGTAELAAGSVTGAKIASLSITGTQLADGGIGGAKIAAGSITGSHIADGGITGADIFDGTVGTADLANLSVTSAKIAAGAVTGQELANGAVTAAKIAGNSITSQEIAVGGITATALGDNSVSTAKLQNSSVTFNKLAINSVHTTEILDGEVRTADIADGAVNALKIAANTITDQELAPAAVTSTVLADNAVSTAKLQNGAVTSGKLALNAVRTTEILDGEVRTADLGAAAVTGPKLAANAVTVDKLGIVPAVRLRVSAATFIPQAGSEGFLNVPWDVEDYDTQNMHDPANPTRLTVPVRGIYRLSVTCSFVEWFGTDISLQVRKNQIPTASDPLSLNWVSAAVGSGNGILNASTDVKLEAGDYLIVAVESSLSSGGFDPNWLSQYLSSVSLTFVSNAP